MRGGRDGRGLSSSLPPALFDIISCLLDSVRPSSLVLSNCSGIVLTKTSISASEFSDESVWRSSLADVWLFLQGAFVVGCLEVLIYLGCLMSNMFVSVRVPSL